MNSSKQIKLGAVISYITIFFNIIASLLYTPWMVQSIGQSNYGLYTLAISLISMFTIDFGMSAATTSFVSKYNAESDPEGVNNLLGIIYKLYLLVSGIIFLVLLAAYFFIDLLYASLTRDELSVFKVIYIIFASYSIISFPFVTLNGILAAFEKFIALKLCDLIQKLTTVLLVVLALSYGYGINALVAANAVTGLLMIIVKLFVIKKSTPVKVNYKFKSKKILKEILGFSIWSTVISTCQRLIFNITPPILGMICGSVAIAVFGAASSLEAYVYSFSCAISGLFLPMVSRIIANKQESNDILSLMIKVGRIQLFLIGMIFIGFVAVGQGFIRRWLGENYSLSFYCALLIIFPSLIESPQQIADTAVIAGNKVKQKSFAYMIMAGVNILLSFFLSFLFGAIGASLSICIAYLIRTAFMDVVYYKVLNINIIQFFKETYIKFIPSFLCSLGAGICLHLFVPVGGYAGVLLKGTIIVTVYLMLMWFFTLNNFEKNLFKNIFNKVWSRAARKVRRNIENR